MIEGAPAKVWGLSCADGCEDYLRSDPLWAITPLGIPETPDEKTTREDVEKRGSVEQAQSTATALEQLAKLGALPEVMGRFMEYMAAQASKPAEISNAYDELQLCLNGHRNLKISSFCAECGSSLKDPVSSDRGAELPAASGVQVISSEDSGTFVPVIPGNLDNMSIAELRDVAGRLGVKTARSKEDQIALILAATP